MAHFTPSEILWASLVLETTLPWQCDPQNHLPASRLPRFTPLPSERGGNIPSLEDAILRPEPKIDLLHDCLGSGRFAEVTITTEGYFLGRVWGEIGFNHFLGLPSAAVIARTQTIFKKLSKDHQQELLQELHARRIPPESLDIPEN